MKILDITQRSQVQHIAEGRKQLDEIGLLGMGIGGGASYALLAAKHGLNPIDWPMSALGEFALDVGLGAVTGGALTVAKAAAVAAAKSAAKKGLSGVAKGAGRITGKGKGQARKGAEKGGGGKGKGEAGFCWYENAKIAGIQGEKGCVNKKCTRSHKKDPNFDKDARPRSQSPSAGKHSGGKGLGKSEGGDLFKIDKNTGEKIPLCCFEYLKKGSCGNAEKFGEPCRFKHLNQKQYDAALKRLNPTK